MNTFPIVISSSNKDVSTNDVTCDGQIRTRGIFFFFGKQGRHTQTQGHFIDIFIEYLACKSIEYVYTYYLSIFFSLLYVVI